MGEGLSQEKKKLCDVGVWSREKDGYSGVAGI